jgi:hypothetical protein
MPFVPGQERPAGAGRKRGRPAGSLGIKSRMARDLMESENFCPMQALMRIAKDKRKPLELRMDAMKSLLPFCWPKLSAQEIDVRALQFQATARIDEVLHSLPADQAQALEAVALRIAALPAPEGTTAGAVVEIALAPEQPDRPHATRRTPE